MTKMVENSMSDFIFFTCDLSLNNKPKTCMNFSEW